MTFNTLKDGIRLYKFYTCSLGKQLKEARPNFQELVGEGIDTWADFVSQPEIGLSVREANQLMKLYDIFMFAEQDCKGVPMMDINLSIARFCAMRNITNKELIEDMKSLSLKDFREIHYDKTKNSDGKRTYTYMVMRRSNETGNLSKVHGVESEDVLQAFKSQINYGE